MAERLTVDEEVEGSKPSRHPSNNEETTADNAVVFVYRKARSWKRVVSDKANPINALHHDRKDF